MAVDLLAPRFRYLARRVTIASGVNDQLVFREQSGTDLVATLDAGEYTYGELAYRVERALERTGANGYTVAYTYATRSFKLTSDATVHALFELRVGATTRDAWPTLGVTSTKTGALEYVSDAQVPTYTTVTFARPLRTPRVRVAASVGELVLEGGRREAVAWGYRHELLATAEWEPRATAVAWARLLREAALAGVDVEFYPDSAGTDWVGVQVVGTEHDVQDMSAEGAYGYHRLQVRLLEVVPPTGTIRLYDLVDRGPVT